MMGLVVSQPFARECRTPPYVVELVELVKARRFYARSAPLARQRWFGPGTEHAGQRAFLVGLGAIARGQQPASLCGADRYLGRTDAAHVGVCELGGVALVA